MSRSYKKYPCWSAPDSRNGVHSGVHDAKRLANRKARRPWHWDIPSGNAYRKLTDPWDIRDYKSVYYTKAEVNRRIEKAEADMENEGHAWHPWWNYRKYTLRYYYYSK